MLLPFSLPSSWPTNLTSGRMAGELIGVVETAQQQNDLHVRRRQFDTLAPGQFGRNGFRPVIQRLQKTFLVESDIASIDLHGLAHQLSTLSWLMHSSTICA